MSVALLSTEVYLLSASRLSRNQSKPQWYDMRIDVTIRSIDQFYCTVAYLNRTAGTGVNSWTIRKRVLKSLKSGKARTVTVEVFSDTFAESDATLLKLINW